MERHSFHIVSGESETVSSTKFPHQVFTVFYGYFTVFTVFYITVFYAVSFIVIMDIEKDFDDLDHIFLILDLE